jgi:hypothetical protein
MNLSFYSAESDACPINVNDYVSIMHTAAELSAHHDFDHALRPSNISMADTRHQRSYLCKPGFIDHIPH